MREQNPGEVVVIGKVEVRVDCVEQALHLSLQHTRRSREEPGCLSHDVHRDVEHPLRLVFVERWLDPPALARHFAVPASRGFVSALTALASAPPSIRIYAARRLPATALEREAKHD